jgi:hypothetical protein
MDRHDEDDFELKEPAYTRPKYHKDKEYSFRHVVYELLQLKSIVTLTLLGASTWAVVTGAVGWEVYIPIASMALMSFFKKGKNE